MKWWWWLSNIFSRWPRITCVTLRCRHFTMMIDDKDDDMPMMMMMMMMIDAGSLMMMMANISLIDYLMCATMMMWCSRRFSFLFIFSKYFSDDVVQDFSEITKWCRCADYCSRYDVPITPVIISMMPMYRWWVDYRFSADDDDVPTFSGWAEDYDYVRGRRQIRTDDAFSR